jgi:hypothetical protein
MLFDLQGRRRRVVQATYLTLAVLMGGGLVFFGIGGEVSGGLFDAFSDRNATGDDGDEIVEKRIDEAEARLRRNPRDEVALKELVRTNYQLASTQVAPGANEFPDDARDELDAAARAWQRYLALEPRQVDPSLANLMLQAYGPGALERYDEAARTAEIVAEQNETPAAYLQLVQFASLAGKTRIADLAGEKAIELASPRERRAVKEQVEQAKAQAALREIQEQQQQQQQGQGRPTPTPAPGGAPPPEPGGAPPEPGGGGG